MEDDLEPVVPATDLDLKAMIGALSIITVSLLRNANKDDPEIVRRLAQGSRDEIAKLEIDRSDFSDKALTLKTSQLIHQLCEAAASS